MAAMQQTICGIDHLRLPFKTTLISDHTHQDHTHAQPWKKKKENNNNKHILHDNFDQHRNDTCVQEAGIKGRDK